MFHGLLNIIFILREARIVQLCKWSNAPVLGLGRIINDGTIKLER